MIKNKITTALLLLVFLSFGISHYVVAQDFLLEAQETHVTGVYFWPLKPYKNGLSGATFFWTDYVDDIKKSLPALHNVGGGISFKSAIVKSPRGYGLAVNVGTFLEFIGVNNPTFESYYFTLPGIDTSKPKDEYINYTPGSFRIADAIVEITNSYLPGYSKRVQIEFVDGWEYLGKEKRVFSKVFDSEANIEALRKEANVSEYLFPGAFNVRLIQKGYLDDFLLRSKIIEFVTKLTAASSSSTDLNNQNSASSATATAPATTTTNTNKYH